MDIIHCKQTFNEPRSTIYDVISNDDVTEFVIFKNPFLYNTLNDIPKHCLYDLTLKDKTFLLDLSLNI